MNMRKLENNKIFLIGVGIFFLMAAESIGFLIQFTLKNVLFYFEGIPSFAVFLASKLIYLFTFIAGLYLLLKVLERRKISFLKVTYFLLAGIVLGQLLQFFASFLLFDLENEVFYQNMRSYSEFNADSLIRVLDLVFWFIQALVLGWIIYENRDIVLAVDRDDESIEKIGES